MRNVRFLVDEGDGVASIAVVGELDMAEVDTFEERLAQLEQAEPSLLVIDLGELTFIDSHGLSALIDADARARTDGRRLVLTPAPDPVMSVFRITLLDQRFEWADPADPEALERELAEAVRRLRERFAEPER